METQLTQADRKRIDETVRRKYSKVAESPEGLFKYPTGRTGLEALNYDTEIVGSLPEGAVSSYCGVGNPFSLGPINEGESVLDIGCGGGTDTLYASVLVGSGGNAVGGDAVPEMIERANQNLRKALFRNVVFQEASGEDLPFPDNSFDVVISNGVFNLIIDKGKALAEVFRVLKPGGRLMMADQILAGVLPDDMQERIDSWYR